MPSDLKVFAQEWTRGTLRDPLQHFRQRKVRECPICGFKGKFISAGSRQEARCPNCSSKERDRIFQLYLDENGITVEGKQILHFSPERPFWRKWRSFPGYISGDVKRNKVANTAVDITKIQFADEYFDLLICHHVLEHVIADRKAMAECYRVLKDTGLAFFSVPIDATSQETFEPPASMSREEIEKICGWDHKRLYGLDFADRLRDVGFDIEEIAYSSEEAEQYRLSGDPGRRISMDRVYVARKQSERHSNS